MATPKNGIEAEIIVIKNFDELKSMFILVTGSRAKSCCSITPYDKQITAEGRSSKPMAKRLFMARAQRSPRGGACCCVFDPLCGRSHYALPHTGMTDYAKGVPHRKFQPAL